MRICVRSVILMLTIMIAASRVNAHDFWLEPAAFRMTEPGAIGMAVFIGHAGEREQWRLTPDRLVAFARIDRAGRHDLSALVRQSDKGDPGAVTVENTGDSLFLYQSNNRQIFLDAKKFNDYAREEGLTNILQHREATGAMTRGARESYSRRAKMLVRLDPTKNVPQRRHADFVTTPTGQDLEITPLAHPHARAADEPLPVVVHYKGAPLAGAQVELESLSVRIVPAVKQKTDANGVAIFDVPKTGAWKFNVVWSTPTTPPEGTPTGTAGPVRSPDDRAGIAEHDFNTIFASFTFGY